MEKEFYVDELKNIVIIGAGPAGLTAAYELQKKGNGKYNIIILEETNEIGGISRTVKYHGNRMDIGGHRFFSKDDRVMDWWKDVMPIQGKNSYDDRILKRHKKLNPNGPSPDNEDRVMLIRNRVSRIYYKKKFFDYPVSIKWNTIKNMGFITTVKAGVSYILAILHKRRENSLEDFYINRFGKVLYSMFFEGYTEKLWGRHPSQISADWGAQRVKGLSIFAIIKDVFGKIFVPNKNRKIETSLIEEFLYPKYGPGQLWETVAEEFENMGGCIKRNCKVTKINLDDNNSIKEVEYTHDGSNKKIKGDIFISSMPLKDLVEGMGDKVPDRQKKIAEGLPYRDFVTVGLLVDRLNLKNETKIKTLNNIVPDCWIYVQDTGVRLGRIQVFNNWSPYLVKEAKSKVWIGLEYFCNEGDKFWSMSEEKCIKYATKELIKMGIISSTEDVLDGHREKVKKAYPAYFDTYKNIDELINYLNTIDNLYCVGRNGQHRYNNMDHSMATSFEAVENIIGNVASKDNIWNVNTEEEYHETK